MSKKILIFKNDRGGDLVSSLRLIYKLLENNNKVSIYLSEINYNFKFLLQETKINKINFDLTMLDKIKIFINILTNKYDEIFILSPKNFYFYLPLVFKKIKFYGIVINGKKRNRPPLYLRKYLYKYQIAHRNKINKINVIQNQLALLNFNENFNYKKINLPSLDKNVLNNLPKNYFFFQFKKNFFDSLNWNTNEFEKIIKFINSKYEFIVFSADIEKNYYDSYFESNYSSIDFNNENKFSYKNNKNIIYLKKIDPKNLLLIIKDANKILCPHGLITQISYLFNKESVNLFHFKINNIDDYHHEKISFSEWYSNMGIKFTILNNDINKAIRKISKFI